MGFTSLRMYLPAACVLALSACSTLPPQGITAVTGFEPARYSGKWYEIARLDHRFERGLTDVSAVYTREPDGSLRVLNRGYDPSAARWKKAIGRALFNGAPSTASLKVSFFGPFYAGYHVVALDAHYQWALVAGNNRDYLWILSRDKTLPPQVKAALLSKAAALGFATDQLTWVAQTRPDA